MDDPDFLHYVTHLQFSSVVWFRGRVWGLERSHKDGVAVGYGLVEDTVFPNLQSQGFVPMLDLDIELIRRRQKSTGIEMLLHVFVVN